MKRVLKPSEPPALTSYRSAVPDSTWQAMKSDTAFNGPVAYNDCRSQLIANQGGLCAYCEIDIRDNAPLKCRVEHFHPKSDIAPAHNWALDWGNLLGVCAGGSYAHTSTPGHYLFPTNANLSCDAHKDQMIQSGKLSEQCDGWILNPAQLQASPTLFKLEMSTGKLQPNLGVCAISPPWPNNQHADLQALVQHTIDMLNLNCDRLIQARRRIIWDIEHNKKKQRDAGHTPQQGMNNLVQYYLRQCWPGFFTTIRLCLGATVEAHLTNIRYQG